MSNPAEQKFKHPCWHCSSNLVLNGLECFGGKRFISYWCPSCQTHFAIEKKDASLVMGYHPGNEIDHIADVKPIVAIYAGTPLMCREIADVVRSAGAHALEHTFTFSHKPSSANDAAALVLSMHNIFRAHAVVLTPAYRDNHNALTLQAFARALGKPVFFEGEDLPRSLCNFFTFMPPPGVNLWHEQMLLDLVGIPPT